MRRILSFLTVLVMLSLLLSGCGAGTTQDIARKAEKAKTKEQLEAALGRPDKFEEHKIGGVSGELWTYKASDGEVRFIIVNGKKFSTDTTEKKH